MNYQIVTDEAALRQFIEWLPECAENEKFYACLFMRKKYCKDVPWIKSDKGQLKRFLASKDQLYDKIRQLEVAVGAYRFDDNPTPQESLALYITPNPRDMWAATIKSISKLAHLIECQNKNANPHAEVMSEIQRNAGNRKFIMFDIDEKNEETIKTCIDLTSGYCDVTETRGGYHIFVHRDKVDLIEDKMWYKKIASFSDQTGDNMTPVVGTYQGGHTPRFINFCKE